MKKEFLKMAGVENEKDFYKLFPTEQAFFGMYPEAKKLVQKKRGGQLQKFEPGGFLTTFTTTSISPKSSEIKTNPESGFQSWRNYTNLPDQGWTKNLDDVIVTSTRPKQGGLNGEFVYDGPTMDVEFDDQGNPRYVTRPGQLRFERNQDKFENQMVWQYNTPSAVADRETMDEIRRTGPQLNQAQEERPWYSKAAAVATHPFTAWGYNLRGERMPDYFERGSVNPVDRALQVTAVLAGARGALPYLNAPFTVGSKTLPWLTASNVLGAYGATDFALNRATELPGQIQRGEYADALTNATFGALDLMGLNLAKPSLFTNTGRFISQNTNKLNPFRKANYSTPVQTGTRQATIEIFNPKTNMYENRLVDVPEQIIPGRSFADVAHKEKNLRKDLNISLPEHYLNKWFGRSPISLERDKGLIINPEGRIWDSNTRYWLNRQYGNTPDPLELIEPNVTQYARSFGKVISESPTPTMQQQGKLIFNPQNKVTSAGTTVDNKIGIASSTNNPFAQSANLTDDQINEVNIAGEQIDKFVKDRVAQLNTPEGRRRIQQYINDNPQIVGNKTVDDIINEVEGMESLNKIYYEDVTKSLPDIVNRQDALRAEYNAGKIPKDVYTNNMKLLTEEEGELRKQLDEFENMMGEGIAYNAGPFNYISPGYLKTDDIATVAEHEILGHGSHQSWGQQKTALDEKLENLQLLDQPYLLPSSVTNQSIPVDKRNALLNFINSSGDYFKQSKNYFKRGSKSLEKLPHALEVRQQLLKEGKIKNIYDPIPEEMLIEHYNNYMNMPQGVKYPLRIYDIMQNSPYNFKLLSEVLNKAHGVVPTAIGVGGAGYLLNNSQSSSEQYKKGGLVKAQDGTEYTGSSIVDYLATKGYKGSKPFRSELAKEYGVEGYDYSAAKNLELLEKLRQNQDLLLAHKQSFTPVAVETIEQLHAKNKAGLNRHSSLPGKKEAKYEFDQNKFNTLLDIATMPISGGMGTMPQFGFRNAPQYAAINKKRVASTPSDPTSRDYTADPGGYYGTTQEGEKAFVLPEVVVTSPKSKKQLLEEEKAKKGAMDQFNKYLDYSRSLLQIPFRPGQKEYTEFDVLPEEGLPNKQNQKNNLGFFDYLNLGTKAAGLFLNEFLDPGRNIERMGNNITDLFQMGQSYLTRKKALKEGDDLTKSKSTISIPKVETPTIPESPLVIENTPYAEGSTIEMYDKKDKRYITKPLWLDLGSPDLRLGTRNRGSQLGDIKTQGFVITPFAKEYGIGKGYTDDNGRNTIRKYNDNEIVDDKIYGGVDAEGKFHLDYGKNLKGKNLEMADFRSMDISGIAKQKDGKYIYGDATNNKAVARTAKAFDEKGNPTVDLNLLIPKKQINVGHESFGAVGGGRFILATRDLKKKVLVAGSLKNIDEYVEQFKKATGSSVITLIPLDNGTFARGLSTTDGVITNKDQQRYDNFNETGGAAFYLKQKRHGGSILPRMDVGGTPPNCDPGYMPDPNDPTKCIQDPNFLAKFSPKAPEVILADEQMDETFNSQFPTTQTTTTWVQWYNQNLANSVIDPPKDIYGNPMSMEWQGDPTYDPSKKTDMYGNVITATTTKSPKYLFGKLGEWADKSKTAKGVKTAASVLNNAFAFGNKLVADNQYREFQRNYEENLRNKIFRQPVMPSVSGSRGDYVTNTGAFRPNEYTVNKGMYTSNMPGAIVGTQQFAQFGAEILPPALEPPVIEFSPIIAPSQQEYITTSQTTNPSEEGNNYDLPSAGNYVLPLKTWDVRSGFGHRKAPLKGASTDHNGVDLRAKPNTEVFSPFDGTVSKIYYEGKGGKQLIIKHDDGTRSGYAHLNDYKVNVGDRVSKGQLIALTGNTGNSTGPHLHFTFTGPDGKKLDPDKIFGNYTKPSGSSQSGGGKAPGGSIAVTHNNPGNIHYGDFVKQWGATKGSLDAGSTGNVAVFNSIEDGWDAFNKLLFGNAYKNLTIAEARNKWVTGQPSGKTPSTSSIVKEMGLDPNTKVSELTPEQRKKYSSLFVKHEDGNMYRKMKGLKFFEKGGEVDYNEGDVYDLTEDEIKQILENGGQLEFI